jgi:uroporphyrinogen decarboxylase
MNQRERFLTALCRKEPDKVPICELHIDEPIIRKLADLLEIRPENRSKSHERMDYVELFGDVVERLDLDAVIYSFSYGFKNISENQCQDKFGRIYALSPHGEPLPIKPRVESLADLENFDMAAQITPEDFADLQYIIERFGKTRACLMPLSDPYKESWRTLGGMQTLLLNFRINPELVRRLLRITTDFAHKAIDMAVKLGIDAFIMPGDFAHETGLLFSLDDYRDYLKPLHKEIVDHVHQREAMIVKHSDGNVWPLLDEWMEVGFDGFHPIQPQCMDIKEVKAYVGKKMALVGNIDCRTLLVLGTPEEVKRAVKETIGVAAPGGGYIISSSNSIHPNCKPENYLAMVEASHEYREVY